jgi:hypothetical protein
MIPDAILIYIFGNLTSKVYDLYVRKEGHTMAFWVRIQSQKKKFLNWRESFQVLMTYLAVLSC